MLPVSPSRKRTRSPGGSSASASSSGSSSGSNSARTGARTDARTDGSTYTDPSSKAQAAATSSNCSKNQKKLNVASSMEEFLSAPSLYQPRKEWLLDDEHHPKSSDPPILYCLKRNAHKAAKRLIEAGANVNACNPTKQLSPLILASQRGSYEICCLLLQKGANAHHVTIQGTTAVLQAAHYGHLNIVKALLKASGNNTELMEFANHHQTTPLMRAAQEGHYHVCQWLLQQGASVNRKNLQSMTCLMLASQRGHANIVQLLLLEQNKNVSSAINIDARTEQNNSTALLLAVKRGHTKVVQVLVQHGCELYYPDSKGRIPLELAIGKLKGTQMINLLLPERQVELLQQKARKDYNWQLCKLYHLQQRQVTQQESSVSLTQLVLQELPLGLFQKIVEYIPLPNQWEQRIGLLTQRAVVNAVASVRGALDIIDEVLELGGFCKACDLVHLPPPEKNHPTSDSNSATATTWVSAS